MLRSSFILLICLFTSVLLAQDEKWDRKTLKKARTASQLSYLTNVEKDVIFYTNLVRMNPLLFEKTFLQTYIKKNEMEPNRWIRSLKIALRKTEPMNELIPREDLYKAAKKHAIDMGKSGKIGHKTSRGKSFDDRMKHLYKAYQQVYENCNYGFADGLSIVCDLLIDMDVPDAGHRKTILNPALRYIGTSVQPHKEYQVNCVQDLGS